MPCPVFHPTKPVPERSYKAGRLPLLDQYEGFCTAHDGIHVPEQEILFRCCNHGYSKGSCSRLPVETTISCMRYSVVHGTAEKLEILCVEETEHAPERWYTLEYLVERADLKGNLSSECVRAQAAAFCQAYLRHTRSEPN